VNTNIADFIFGADTLRLDPANDYVAEIPPAIDSVQTLFDALRRELRLPAYFGDNWDAVEECLRDLHWIKVRRVIIVHRDLPRLEARPLKVYLDVLSSSVRDWKPSEAHELAVVFPREAYNGIINIIWNL
jgi:Barstar (barnase inhibitor)